MSDVFVDPDRLDGFANELRSMNELVTRRMDELSNLVGKLGSSWRDQQFGEFRDCMMRARARLQTFSGEVKQAVAQLEIDSAAAREAQRVQVPNG